MKELLEKIETRQQLVRETAEQLRDQITGLTEQLAAAEETLKRLETTRETILELAAEDGTPPPEPLPAGYHGILALFEQTGEGLRAKQVCQALGLGTGSTAHRKHPSQAETPGGPRHPHRTRAWDIHPRRGSTSHPRDLRMSVVACIDEWGVAAASREVQTRRIVRTRLHCTALDLGRDAVDFGHQYSPFRKKSGCDLTYATQNSLPSGSCMIHQ
ncbi:tektin family protein [Streptomyces noursei]|uniref:tektin family protein n=1 Tax=Streptomyces noursei TaxID=1971 RepID=UPI00198E5B8C|nr:tektin family protein [Streptomyces noursei]MCZ1020324.1 hypothetical protein [Streptomyces noursei]GGX57447.1 hypothetical protein GCM10010341_91810 [Streptomyces noursei]